MPKFSLKSKSHLQTCHSDLQVLFNEVIKSWDCLILEGHRGKAAQDKAVREGNSKTPWPTSKHNKAPSLAVDVAPYPLPDWKKQSDFVYFAGFVQGIARKLYDENKIKHLIRYGGDFNKNHRISDSTFFDLVHFEIIL